MNKAEQLFTTFIDEGGPTLRKNSRKYVYLSVVIIALVVVAMGSWVFRSETIQSNNIGITEVNTDGSNILITGSLLSSAAGYKGFTVEYKEGDLIVKVKGQSIGFGKMNGDFKISIDKSKYEEIKALYLADGKTKKEIWKTNE